MVLRIGSFRFFFCSNEGDPRELVHVHVTRAPATAKFWVRPEVSLAYNRGFPPRVLSELVSVIEARAEEIERHWNDHFA